MLKNLWKQDYKLIPSALLLLAGAVTGDHYGKIAHPGVNQRIISWCGDAVFLIFAVIFLNIVTASLRNAIAARRMGVGRAASLQFALRVVGYAVIVLITLNLLNISVGKVLLGGAVLGIIVGVAAQQALGNFFASIVLIASRPFTVGQHISLTSGALGGQFNGVIKDVGLVYTKLLEDNGNTVLLPNATILSGASIRLLKPQEQPKESKGSK